MGAGCLKFVDAAANTSGGQKTLRLLTALGLFEAPKETEFTSRVKGVSYNKRDGKWCYTVTQKGGIRKRKEGSYLEEESGRGLHCYQ